jgi:serine O-acetyltransferase
MARWRNSRAERLSKVALRLEDQVRKSVRIGDPKKPTGRTPPILRHFFHSLSEVRELLRTDIEAAYEGDPAALYSEEIILSYPFIEAITIQRLAHILYVAGAPIIPRMMTEWAHSRTGIDIHPGAKIGSHFFIDHGTGVVIGETCKIGKRVKLYHGVTLGARSFAKDEAGHIVKGGKRHPERRGQRDDLSELNHSRRRNGHRRELHHRRECVSDAQRPAGFAGGL